MRWCFAVTLATFLASGASLFGQERRDKPEGDKPAKPEFKPPFGRGGPGPGFGPFRPPANREEAIQRVRQQLEFARNMVRQLEEQLKRLEAGDKPAADRKPEPRREGEARKPEKPDQPEARKPGPPGKPEARRPGSGDKPGFDRFRGRFGERRPPFGRGPQPQWGRWGFWPRFGGPWWPQPGRFWPQPGRFAPGWPRWGWTPRFTPPAPRFAPPQRPAAPRADRASDLESRLERLTRELEELRRELRQRR
ncbi:MAG: hypothetical protein NZM42_06855 [Gemmatales bacterium]|nr:hypothetical protein [Gemmatales bacterium]MDW8223481.1 hypothetical protein [Gemmatales bacterium]